MGIQALEQACLANFSLALRLGASRLKAMPKTVPKVLANLHNAYGILLFSGLWLAGICGIIRLGNGKPLKPRLDPESPIGNPRKLEHGFRRIGAGFPFPFV